MKRASKGALRAAEAPVVASSAEAFSLLDLRDRVVIMAIFYEIVEVEHVEKAWRWWRAMQQKGSTESLWRVLTRDPDLRAESIYEVAAQIYGCEEAEINRLRALALIRDLSRTFTREQWQRLFELLVIPVAIGEDPRTGHARLVFATHDPARPEVPRLLQRLDLNSFELRYAAPSVITELFSEIFEPKVEVFPSLQDAGTMADASTSQEIEPEPIKEKQNPVERDPRSLVDWFDSVLVAAYQERATEVHIFRNDERDLEIHFLIEERLQLWRKEDIFHPEGLLAYIMNDIIKVDDFEPGVIMEVSFKRWIQRDLTRFHLSFLLADDSDELGAGTIVIRVLGHRDPP